MDDRTMYMCTEIIALMNLSGEKQSAPPRPPPPPHPPKKKKKKTEMFGHPLFSEKAPI